MRNNGTFLEKELVTEKYAEHRLPSFTLSADSLRTSC
jgi:hypothetical protein